MRAVFLVPRRSDGGHRDRLWDYARVRWQTLFPHWDIVEGHHDEGSFNRSAAVNRAAETAGSWDVAVVIDSDVMLRKSLVQRAVDMAAENGRVTWPHRRWRGISEDWTRRIIADRQQYGPEFEDVDLDVLVERTNPLSWSCCIAIPRAVWDDLGGFDERFKGWGFEDMAFQSVVVGLYGYDRLEGDVIHLWHPRSSERIILGQSSASASPDYITNALLGRRYMYALRRDHKLHDRSGGPATEDERLRDMANLKRDDERFLALARARRLPDWSKWWPTLEELRDGARAARSGPQNAHTVILRTGGDADTWGVRSAYLRASVASLAERVHGNIVQRVIYSDWGNDHRAEIEAIGAEHGFYVAGSGHHGYTESARRLWRYISQRALGDMVFLTEDDFTFDRDVDLDQLAEPLRADSRLRQMSLLRQPVFDRESSGLLGWPLDSFAQVDGHLEHRNFWTMNPSLFRRSLTETPWPTRESSERAFGDAVLRDPKARVGIWGTGERWVTHIGEVRSTSVY
jgi:hypothetical protein